MDAEVTQVLVHHVRLEWTRQRGPALLWLTLWRELPGRVLRAAGGGGSRRRLVVGGHRDSRDQSALRAWERAGAGRAVVSDDGARRSPAYSRRHNQQQSALSCARSPAATEDCARSLRGRNT